MKPDISADTNVSCSAKSNPNSNSNLHIPSALFYIFVCIALYIGWRIRTNEYLIAKSGAGYWLGIAGSVMMLLLLLYPARKRFSFMRNLGNIRRYYQLHWIMGITGPVLILFHCNFRIGSLNSSIALFSTLLVAISGLIGRYLYTKVNYALSMKHISLKNLRKQAEDQKNALASVFYYAPALKKRLTQYEKVVHMPEHGLIRSLGYIIFLSIWSRYSHLKIIIGLKRALTVTAKRESWSATEIRLKKRQARQLLDSYMILALRIGEFNFYEKLLGLWHIFHFPLYILLIIVAAVHIVAVHMF